MARDDSDIQPQNALPRPFFDDVWPGPLRPAAQALWRWHLALREAGAGAFRLSEMERAASFAAVREDVEEGQPIDLVPEEIWLPAYQACAEHGLSRSLLARQVAAASHFGGPIRFRTATEAGAFIDDWARPLGRLLAELADVAYSWQLPLIDEFTTALFWTGRLAELPRDLERDWLFLPEQDLEQAGVTLEQLHEGRVDEGMRRLLWKEAVRARDAYAQSELMVRDLPRPYAGGVKRWWFGGLEVLNEIQRREYDVWSRPITLSWRHRLQVHYQSRFGRTTFRS